MGKIIKSFGEVFKENPFDIFIGTLCFGIACVASGAISNGADVEGSLLNKSKTFFDNSVKRAFK